MSATRGARTVRRNLPDPDANQTLNAGRQDKSHLRRESQSGENLSKWSGDATVATSYDVQTKAERAITERDPASESDNESESAEKGMGASKRGNHSADGGHECPAGRTSCNGERDDGEHESEDENSCFSDPMPRAPIARNMLQFSEFVGVDDGLLNPKGRFKRCQSKPPPVGIQVHSFHVHSFASESSFASRLSTAPSTTSAQTPPEVAWENSAVCEPAAAAELVRGPAMKRPGSGDNSPAPPLMQTPKRKGRERRSHEDGKEQRSYGSADGMAEGVLKSESRKKASSESEKLPSDELGSSNSYGSNLSHPSQKSTQGSHQQKHRDSSEGSPSHDSKNKGLARALLSAIGQAVTASGEPELGVRKGSGLLAGGGLPGKKGSGLLLAGRKGSGLLAGRKGSLGVQKNAGDDAGEPRNEGPAQTPASPRHGSVLAALGSRTGSLLGRRAEGARRAPAASSPLGGAAARRATAAQGDAVAIAGAVECKGDKKGGEAQRAEDMRRMKDMQRHLDNLF